uniref:Sema domain-containing protein n=1 Tax=Tetranychus urticae TaxID=32264 RepID=A0A158P4W2_TETUR
MFNSSLLLIIKLCLLIVIAHSFDAPKHDITFYYKTPSNVFLPNPENLTTFYGIYLLGKTIYINVPKSVVNVYNIVNWKVINLNKDRLMFVYNKKPQILIGQGTIKEMEYSGELSDSIIAFGDNEALHVPTISNPSLTKPAVNWNYIELLRFDDKTEKVSVIKSLSWLKDDDWKFIKEWKMMDYMHFDNKLYLLIKQSIWNEEAAKVTQEISIIRLCLDKGSELISSAVEMHFTRPEFDANELHEVIFAYFSGRYNGDNESKSFYLVTNQHFNQSAIIVYYYFDHLFPLFEQTAKSCSSGVNNVTLLRHHLRSEVGGCKKTNHERCSTKENMVPSKDISNLAVIGKLQSLSFAQKSVLDKIEHVALPFPLDFNALFIYLGSDFYSLMNLVRFDEPKTDLKPEVKPFKQTITSSSKIIHINKRPFEGYYLTPVANQVTRVWFSELCPRLTTCTHCMMYGPSLDCVWTNGNCTNTTINHQSANETGPVNNSCFKINKISPLIINSSLPTTLKIELDEPVNITKAQETLVIKAGPHNHCTNIKMNGATIECSMKLNKSGEFNIAVDLVNTKYAHVYSLGAVSVDKVTITAAADRNKTETGLVSNPKNNTFAIILVLFVGLLLSTFLFVGYTQCGKQQMERLVPGSKNAKQLVASQEFIPPAGPKISSKMNAQTGKDSAKLKESTSKLDQASKLKPADKSGKSSEALLSKKGGKSLSSKPKGKLEKPSKSSKSLKSMKSQKSYSGQWPPLLSKSVNRNMKF